MKKYSIALLLAFVSVITFGQKKKVIPGTDSLLASSQYVFKLQNVLPMNGRTIFVTGGFELRLNKDTLSSYLPYYGRAYIAPINPGDAGLNFISTDFNYSIFASAKDGWDISFKPKESRNINSMRLHVSSTGYASLSVSFNDRQPISYDGYISRLD